VKHRKDFIQAQSFLKEVDTQSKYLKYVGVNAITIIAHYIFHEDGRSEFSNWITIYSLTWVI